jgi:two-component system nitrogen regulation sensor histidine kinase GlnL
MTAAVKATSRRTALPVGLEVILNSIPDAVLVLDSADNVVYANMTAEDFFFMSVGTMTRLKLSDLVAFGSPLLTLVEQVRAQRTTISEYDVEVGNPRAALKAVDLQVAPVIDQPDVLVVLIRERSIAQKIDRQLTHRGAARSVMGMAAVLAHEIKNPLSGIRGSAQLLEQSVGEEDRELTQLITEEADRICALVDRMEAFSDRRPLEPQAVNLHRVLEHVRKLAISGFARGLRFTEIYDPSLPPAMGDKDQLIQVFLNLVKNAAEAVLPATSGEIALTTAYRHGVRLAVPGSTKRVHLPLEVCVIDNGPGVPNDLKPYLFDPFVTTKSSGTGLGLALVAKIIGDHGGIVECDSEAGRTVFRVLLPAFEGKWNEA